MAKINADEYFLYIGYNYETIVVSMDDSEFCSL